MLFALFPIIKNAVLSTLRGCPSHCVFMYGGQILLGVSLKTV
jgi:hypothetical protein